jgi:drug/metabolite transporter (DMT)-like permease
VAAGLALALAAALVFEGGYVLQARAARSVPSGQAVGLVGPLLRTPAFAGGALCGVVGFALQALALSRVPLAVVQPVLALGLIALLVFATRFLGERPGPQEVGGVVLVACGTALTVAVAAPLEGEPGRHAWVVLVALGAVAGVALLSRSRVGWLLVGGAAAGDVLAALAAARLGAAGLHEPWWAAVAAAGALGAVLSESAALQTLPAVRVGPVVLAAQVVGPVLLAGPVTGQPWPSGGDGVLTALGLAVTASGVVMLAASRQVAALSAEPV